MSWGRILALEITAFLTISLFAAFGGNSLLRAEAGMDGGRVGWGLVNLFWRLGETGGTLLLFILWVFMILTGFGVWALLERWLLKMAGDPQPQPVEAAAASQVQDEAPVEETVAEKPARKKPAARFLLNFENPSR